MLKTANNDDSNQHISNSTRRGFLSTLNSAFPYGMSIGSDVSDSSRAWPTQTNQQTDAIGCYRYDAA